MGGTAEYQKRRYHERVKAGLCPYCGKPAATDRVRCATCHEKFWNNRNGRRHCSVCDADGHVRRDHPRLGLCADCPSKPRVFSTGLTDRRCEACEAIYRANLRKRVNELSNEKRVAALAQGKCGRCHTRKLAKGSKSRCKVCLAYAAQHERDMTMRRKAAAVV